MKVKNIVFSGFAAAILMGAVDANATTVFQIASRGYVDQQINALSGSGGAVAEVDGKVDTLADQIAGENEELNDELLESTTVVGAINELAAGKQDALTPGSNITISDGVISATDTTYSTGTDSTAGLTKLYATTGNSTDGTMTQGAITTALGNKADATDLTTLSGLVAGQNETVPSTIGETSNITTVVGAINALNTKTSSMATSATMTELQTRVSTAEGEIDALQAATAGYNSTNTVAAALADKQNSLNVAQLAAVNSGIDSTKVSTYDGYAATIAGKQAEITSSAKLNADLVDDTNSTNKFVTASDKTTWNGKQNALDQTQLDSITAAATLLAAGYNTCISQQSGSGHCVLTADENGLSWIDVTNPFEATIE